MGVSKAENSAFLDLLMYPTIRHREEIKPLMLLLPFKCLNFKVCFLQNCLFCWVWVMLSTELSNLCCLLSLSLYWSLFLLVHHHHCSQNNICLSLCNLVIFLRNSGLTPLNIFVCGYQIILTGDNSFQITPNVKHFWFEVWGRKKEKQYHHETELQSSRQPLHSVFSQIYVSILAFLLPAKFSKPQNQNTRQ